MLLGLACVQVTNLPGRFKLTARSTRHDLNPDTFPTHCINSFFPDAMKARQERTSVKSSMLVGLMSTMLKLCSVISKFHRLMRRSSADRNVSWSLLTEMELMW